MIDQWGLARKNTLETEKNSCTNYMWLKFKTNTSFQISIQGQKNISGQKHA